MTDSPKKGKNNKQIKRRTLKEEYYEVEAIKEHAWVKVKGGKREMEVHVVWKGYEETTWESFSTFAQDSPEVV